MRPLATTMADTQAQFLKMSELFRQSSFPAGTATGKPASTATWKQAGTDTWKQALARKRSTQDAKKLDYRDRLHRLWGRSP